MAAIRPRFAAVHISSLNHIAEHYAIMFPNGLLEPNADGLGRLGLSEAGQAET